MKRKKIAMMFCGIVFIVSIMVLAIAIRNIQIPPVIGGADTPTLMFVIKVVLRTPMGVICSAAAAVSLILFLVILFV